MNTGEDNGRGLLEKLRHVESERDSYKTLYERERRLYLELRDHQPRSTIEAYCKVIAAISDAIAMGGVSSGKLAEMIGASVADLHGAGLQHVANSIGKDNDQ